MPETTTSEESLAACLVDPAGFELRPDYRALLFVINELTPDTSGEELHAAGDAHAEATTRLDTDMRVRKHLVTA